MLNGVGCSVAFFKHIVHIEHIVFPTKRWANYVFYVDYVFIKNYANYVFYVNYVFIKKIRGLPVLMWCVPSLQ